MILARIVMRVLFSGSGSGSGAQAEKCVLCGSKTWFNRNDPIEERTSYVEGSGQLCHACGARMRAASLCRC